MRCSRHVVAPLLASTALGLLTGCHGQSAQCVNDDHQVVDSSLCRDGSGTPVTTHTYHLEHGTHRGGFGENFAPILLGCAAAALIIGTGG